MALSMIKSLKDTAEFTKALIEYLSLKNKVLYSGTAEWNSGSKTVANITKYQTIKVYPWDGYDGITLERVGSKFQGTGFATNVSNGSHTSLGFVLKVTQQDVVTIEVYSLLHHTKSTSHSALYDGWIKKIVGIEPIVPDTLKTLEGGYYVRLGGGLRAKLAKVLARYRQRMAEDFCWGADGQPENRVIANPVGKHINERFLQCKSGRKIYTVSCSIFSCSSRIWAMHVFNQLFGFVQHYSKQHFRDSVQYGIQKQLYYDIYHSCCLARNRQSVAPRRCCHV